MFIPIWVLHLVVTIIFVIALLWSLNSESDYDFSVLFKLPTVCLGYAIYWIIVLVIKVVHK
jgi:hypothetical protein